MNHLHRRVVLTGIVALALVAGAYALLGIGFAAIIAVGVFICLAIALTVLILVEEDTHLPWREAAKRSGDHGYDPHR